MKHGALCSIPLDSILVGNWGYMISDIDRDNVFLGITKSNLNLNTSVTVKLDWKTSISRLFQI